MAPNQSVGQTGGSAVLGLILSQRLVAAHDGVSHHDMRRVFPILVLVIALAGGVLFFNVRSPQVAQLTREQWLQQATRRLLDLGPPSADGMQRLSAGEWIDRDYVFFSNDWASYTFQTAHDTNGIGDVMLLRTSDGSFYVSHHHFCMGLRGEYAAPDQPRPRDAAHFLELYGATNRWTKY